jgi:hypothetical protein
MTIEKIKEEMKKFRDLYGGDLISLEFIDNATTKQELAKIIEEHRTHMEMMLCDANSHLDNFKGRLGLRCL